MLTNAYVLPCVRVVQFGRYFECDKRDSSVFQELRAGVVCFLTVSYIIPVSFLQCTKHFNAWLDARQGLRH